MHLNEDDLVLHYYGEDAGDETRIDAHLASCGECRSAFEALRRVMETIDAAPVPEPGPAFERTVWARLEADEKWGQTPFSGSVFQKMGSVPIFAFGLAIILIVGAVWMTTTRAPFVEPETGSAGVVADADAHRERVMLAAVSEHIEQSQFVLVELANAEPSGAGVDVSLERTAADDLVSAGRLYRETAIETGNMQLAALLDDLEMVLVEIARGPDALSPDDLTALRRQIETQELIFKLQVLGADIRTRQQTATPSTSQRTL